MSADAAPSLIRRRMARREAALWLSAFGWPALRVLVLGAALGVALVVLASETVDSIGEGAAMPDLLSLGVRYGLLMAVAPAVWAGVASLALRLARGWAVVPALTLPLYVAIACWLRADALRSAMRALSAAVDRHLDQGGVEVLRDLAPAAGGAPLPTDVPMLMAHAGDAFLDGPVRVALAALEGEVGITLIAALVPGVLVSIVALSVGYRRGWAERHEADLERLRRAASSPAG